LIIANSEHTGKMTSVFASSFSSSMNRQSMLPPAPPAEDQLPSIDFGFDDLRDRMAKFTAKFDAFIDQGRKRVLEERNAFRMNLAELEGMAIICNVSDLKDDH
jgi:kinetochore protein Spc25